MYSPGERAPARRHAGLAARLTDRPLPLLLALSIVLHGCAIWWGVVHGEWAVDEIRPATVHDAIDARFAGGWFSAYGPLPFYIYAILFAPVRLAAQLGLVDLYSTPAYVGLHLVIRLVVLGMATGIVATLYLAARELWGRTAAIFTALAGMSVLPFVYYAKMGNVDVPYAFWGLLAIVNYGRIVGRPGPARASYWWFATFATLAVCTKDQAYAFFTLPALHILFVTWRARSTARLLPVLAGAAAWAVVLFALCHNVLLNWDGVIRHFALISVHGPRLRMFDPGPMGQLSLAWATLRVLAWSMNWVGFAAAVAGIAVAALAPPGRRHLWLLVPAVSYYCTLIVIIGFFYDRYYILLCLLLAFFAGRFCALVWERGTAARIAIAVAIAFSVARGGSINLLMLNDSRITVERWVQEHVPSTASVAVVGIKAYLPRIVHPGVRYYRRASHVGPDERPDIIVFNADFVAARFPEGTERGRWFDAVRSGEAGYARTFSAKSRVPLAIVWHEGTFRDREENPYTNLDKINPRIDVYRRAR